MFLLASSASDQTVHVTINTYQKIAHTLFNARSIIVLAVALTVGFALGRFVATILRRVVVTIGKRADKSENLSTVNRLRRYETYIILSIAVIRTFLIILGLYFWWVYTHPAGQPTAIIGASALAVIIISGALSPVLRDLAAGSFMMAEQWYGVGDHIKVEPFMDLQGVVERVTLRSTRIRGLTGEVIWISNQNIQGVRVAPKGIRTLALEMFVDDLAAGKRLLSLTNQRLPTGPLARYADSEAERRFARAIRNARKNPAPKRLLSKHRVASSKKRT